MLTTLSVVSLDQGKIWEDRPPSTERPEERRPAAIVERRQPAQFWLALLRALGRCAGA